MIHSHSNSSKCIFNVEISTWTGWVWLSQSLLGEVLIFTFRYMMWCVINVRCRTRRGDGWIPNFCTVDTSSTEASMGGNKRRGNVCKRQRSKVINLNNPSKNVCDVPLVVTHEITCQSNSAAQEVCKCHFKRKPKIPNKKKQEKERSFALF